MRRLITLPTEKINEALELYAVDIPDEHGVKRTRYEISGFDFSKNPLAYPPERLPLDRFGQVYPLLFQQGNPNEVGINGLTTEALLTVIIDRLECFQATPMASRENEKALEHFKTGMRWVRARSESRLRRGTSGTPKS